VRRHWQYATTPVSVLSFSHNRPPHSKQTKDGSLIGPTNMSYSDGTQHSNGVDSATGSDSRSSMLTDTPNGGGPGRAVSPSSPRSSCYSLVCMAQCVATGASPSLASRIGDSSTKALTSRSVTPPRRCPAMASAILAQQSLPPHLDDAEHEPHHSVGNRYPCKHNQHRSQISQTRLSLPRSAND
jgi:hypothetical protein